MNLEKLLFSKQSKPYFKLKKIAISGSSGFLGSYLAKRLEKEFELVLLTRESNKLNEIKKKFPNLSI